MTVRILRGDCIDVMRTLEAESVQTVVTSPPYFGLRDYGVAGQIGMEASPAEYVARLVDVFREVRRVLRSDGTLWLNLGDSYCGVGGQSPQMGEIMKDRARGKENIMLSSRNRPTDGLKIKDLIGIPWRVAFALQADGWYLRQDIIWHKPNPMPESVTDRCTKAHEYLFLMSKAERYYFDGEGIAEPVSEGTVLRYFNQHDLIAGQAGSDRVPGKTNGRMKAVVKKSGNKERKPGSARGCPEGSGKNVCGSVPWEGTTRNKRTVWRIDEDEFQQFLQWKADRMMEGWKTDVWTVTTKPFKEAHFATFPPDFIEPCILAGSPGGGMVLDPFGGAGTTGLVSDRHGRDAILIELNPEYAAIAEKRIRSDSPLFVDIQS